MLKYEVIDCKTTKVCRGPVHWCRSPKHFTLENLGFLGSLRPEGEGITYIQESNTA
jgi:hypothetical protein